ncbi:sn-glycerol-1-phosphate dehydrogenase [Paenibacillus sp. NPDC058174]|uniref:sn-glycerol-1-phosphate dehydrogenase n=1 Tax=Paenibacillus sp. NPDC058174 TaxID=3346366 RepID=UPI0036D931B7
MGSNTWDEAAKSMEGADVTAFSTGPVVLEHGAIEQIIPYLKSSRYESVVIAADSITWEAGFGSKIQQWITAAGIKVGHVWIRPNDQGDVIADEASVVQLTIELKIKSAEAVIALGSGTLHDIARFAAFTTGIPFISVPTAPSVDGFNSKGAPLILRGEKKTIAAIGPDAIFADLDILTKAPAAMVAAGFGDMLGKYTSLFDWKFGSIYANEPYSERIAEMTRAALQQCVEQVDQIAARTPEGIRLLMGALLESGFAMLLFGQSHPASGAEHHLSHHWEMEFLRTGKRQLLHGAKVGVACAEIAKLYRQLANEGKLKSITPMHSEILTEIDRIPDEKEIRRLLTIVGGPAAIGELGVEDELFRRSLLEAHLIRPNRNTLLKAWNESDKGELK